MIKLNKYEEGKLEFPSVLDVIDFQEHVSYDIIQYEDNIFKPGEELFFNGQKSIILKKIKNDLIKTELNIDRSQLRKVRYFCKKCF